MLVLRILEYDIQWFILTRISKFSLKFTFSEKATKIEKIFTINLTVWNNRQIDDEDFVNFCGLPRKHELYTIQLHCWFDEFFQKVPRNHTATCNQFFPIVLKKTAPNQADNIVKILWTIPIFWSFLLPKMRLSVDLEGRYIS